MFCIKWIIDAEFFWCLNLPDWMGSDRFSTFLDQFEHPRCICTGNCIKNFYHPKHQILVSVNEHFYWFWSYLCVALCILIDNVQCQPNLRNFIWLAHKSKSKSIGFVPSVRINHVTTWKCHDIWEVLVVLWNFKLYWKLFYVYNVE